MRNLHTVKGVSFIFGITVVFLVLIPAIFVLLLVLTEVTFMKEPKPSVSEKAK